MEVIIHLETGSLPSTSISAEINSPRDVKIAVEAEGYDWVASKVLIVNYPEKGRYLIKSEGFSQITAGG